MRPAFRPSPVIYRGVRPRTKTGCCPVCDKPISVTSKGQRRAHRDTAGGLCPGSGVQVRERAAVSYDIDRALELLQAPPPPASPSSPAVRGPEYCQECGRRPGMNGDGTLRAHRPEADTFTGPHCPGGRPKGRA